jgi:hypothetical protein
LSTLRIDNFGPSAGGTTYSARGIAKAWLYYNGVSNTIVGSLNTTSVTDNATGDFTQNITNAFADTSGAVTTGKTNEVSNAGNAMAARVVTSSTIGIAAYEDGTKRDSSHNYTMVMGDLA